jgi:muramoyltetrapeptide carboxypeptidase
MRAFVKDLLSLAKRPNSEAWSEVKNVGAKASARGKLVGGNLSLLTTLGPAALPREPVILALEDVNENHYRLDRMIGNLIDAGYARYVKGIVCGRFLNCGEKDRTSFPFSKIISSLRQLTRGPIWLGARFGHGVKHQRILSLGVKAALSGKKVSWRESAVESR